MAFYSISLYTDFLVIDLRTLLPPKLSSSTESYLNCYSLSLPSLGSYLANFIRHPSFRNLQSFPKHVEEVQLLLLLHEEPKVIHFVIEKIFVLDLSFVPFHSIN